MASRSKGRGEALSVAASRIHNRTTYGNPMDSHLHTGVATRRFLLRLPGVSQRSRVLALLSGLSGPECTVSETMRLPQNPSPPPAPGQASEALLAAILETIEGQPRTNWRETQRIDQLDTPESAWRAMALTEAYLAQGGNAEELFSELGRLVARDDFTELHAIKHQQTWSTNTRPPAPNSATSTPSPPPKPPPSPFRARNRRSMRSWKGCWAVKTLSAAYSKR